MAWMRREPKAKKPAERHQEKRKEDSTAKILAIGFTGTIALLAGMVYGMHSCHESAKRHWRAQTPMCEGLRIYKIRKGDYVNKRGFLTKGSFTVKKGDSIKHEGKTYVVVGAASRDTNGTLIVREKNGENFALIHTGSSEFSRFWERFRFDGWTCEKPKTAKSD